MPPGRAGGESRQIRGLSEGGTYFRGAAFAEEHMRWTSGFGWIVGVGGVLGLVGCGDDSGRVRLQRHRARLPAADVQRLRQDHQVTGYETLSWLTETQ